MSDAWRHRAGVRASTLVGLIIALAMPWLGAAQLSPAISGTWKLNRAKSVYVLGPPPIDQTLRIEPSPDGLRVFVETVAAPDTLIQYDYTAPLDGQAVPVNGALTPNGAETVTVVVVDPFTTEAIFRRGPEIVLTTRTVVSPDGLVLTLTSRGTNRNEQPTNSTTVFDKR